MSKKKELERVAHMKSSRASTSYILKRMSMGQSEERMCEQSKNLEPKKFEFGGE